MADADAQARRVPRWWPAPQKRPDQVPWRWERRKQLERPLLVDHVTRRASQLHCLQHWIAVLRPRLEAQRGLQGGASPGADPGAPPAEEAALRAEEEEAGDQRTDAGEHREDPAPEGRAEPPVAEPAGRPVRRTGWGRFRPPARPAATMSELQAVEAALRQLNAAQKAFWRGDPDGGWVRLHSAEEFEVLAYTWAQVEALRIRLAQEAEKGEFLAETAATLRELLTRSIAMVDAALRRRFHFIPFMPHEGAMESLLRDWLKKHGAPLWVAALVDKVNEQLRILLKGPHLQIGHSHFISDGAGQVKPTLDDDRLARIWQYDIYPFIEDQLYGRPVA